MSEAPTLETQNPTQGETEDSGSLDAAAAAFAAKNEQPQPEDAPNPNEEADPDPESADEPAEEAPEADPEAGDDAGELVEVEIEGKTYKVPPELQKGYLRQSDYSRRMNEVGEKEKAYTQRLELIEGIEAAAEQRAEALAQVRLLDERIKAYEGVDWAKARAENPGEAAMAAIELLSLKDQRKDAVGAAAQVARKLTETKQKVDGEKLADMAKVLDKELPGWRGDVGVQLTAYAKSIGFADKEISGFTDPKVVLALDKARRFDALQASKAQIKAKAKDAPPVVKPGAARPRVDAQQDAMGRLRKSNSLDDAADAFIARRK